MSHSMRLGRLTIIATLEATKAPLWVKPSDPNYNARVRCHHVVKVLARDTRKQFQFDYWTSLARPVITNDDSITAALDCVFSDADWGSVSFKDFCNNFGHSDDSITAHTAYKQCQKYHRKINKVIPEWRQIWESICESN